MEVFNRLTKCVVEKGFTRTCEEISRGSMVFAGIILREQISENEWFARVVRVLSTLQEVGAYVLEKEEA